MIFLAGKVVLFRSASLFNNNLFIPHTLRPLPSLIMPSNKRDITTLNSDNLSETSEFSAKVSKPRGKVNAEKKSNDLDPIYYPKKMTDSEIEHWNVKEKIEPKVFEDESRIAKIMCWNVAGLRGILKSKPNVLKDLVSVIYIVIIICIL